MDLRALCRWCMWETGCECKRCTGACYWGPQLGAWICMFGSEHSSSMAGIGRRRSAVNTNTLATALALKNNVNWLESCTPKCRRSTSSTSTVDLRSFSPGYNTLWLCSNTKKYRLQNKNYEVAKKLINWRLIGWKLN